MIVHLNDPEHVKLIPRFFEKWVSVRRESDLPFLSLAEHIFEQILGKDGAALLDKLGIDPFETVFIKDKPLSVYRIKPLKNITGTSYRDSLTAALPVRLLFKGGVVHVCGLYLKNNVYRFTEPEPIRITADISFVSPDKKTTKLIHKTNRKSAAKVRKIGRAANKHIKKINRYLVAVNNSVLKNLIAGARKNEDFIERFNNEAFYRHVNFNGRKLTPDELGKFYETDPYYKNINLSAPRDRFAFIAMVAIALGCAPEDLFTIDGIFSLQPERKSDNLKKEAGLVTFELLYRNKKDEINGILNELNGAMLKISPPKVDLSDVAELAAHYSLYKGLSEIGRAFSEIFFYNGDRRFDEALTRAEEFAHYGKIHALCDRIAELAPEEDYAETAEYKAAAVALLRDMTFLD